MTDNSKEENQDSFWFLKINVYHFEPVFSDEDSQEESGMERPKFKSSEIDNSGLITVHFSQDLIIPMNATSVINSASLEIKLKPLNDAFTP